MRSTMITALAITAGRSRSGIETRATSSAAVRSVRWVPTPGMSTSADPNVPMMAPTVASEERRPLVRPARSMSVSARRKAKGEAMPSNVTGTENSSRVERNDPTTVPTLTAAKPCNARLRKGRATKGNAAVQSDAMTRIRPRTRCVGCRSATRPPSQ